ncbi:MAG: ribonuclease III [Gammaproteobacteria bacterium]
MRTADWFETHFDYRFRRPELLETALTHSSAGPDNNERLEFIGDAVLNFVIAVSVYRLRPEEHEGTLSRLRANLVKGSSLAALSADLSLGERIMLGAGEQKSGGFQRRSILANALEAVLGAVYLDGGFEVAERCVHRLFAERLASLPEAAALKDPKTRLQEHLQSLGLGLPVYELERVSGRAHEQTFEIACSVVALGIRQLGSGTSRQRAEQAAAGRVLEELGVNSIV